MRNRLFRGATDNATIMFVQFIVNCLLIIIAAFNLDESNILLITLIMFLGILLLSLTLKFKLHNWSIIEVIKSYSETKNKGISKEFFWDSLMIIFYFSMMILLININAEEREIIGQITILIAVLGVIFYIIYTTGHNLQERERAQMVIENMRQIMEADNERNRAVVADLFRRQFEAVDRFASMQYECADDRKLAASYGREAVKLVKNLAPDSAELAKLEDYINRQQDNLMLRLDRAFPQLSKTERIIYMYAVIGLSPRAMSVLLDITIESVYNRKSRLKAKLKSGSAELAEALM